MFIFSLSASRLWSVRICLDKIFSFKVHDNTIFFDLDFFFFFYLYKTIPGPTFGLICKLPVLEV